MEVHKHHHFRLRNGIWRRRRGHATGRARRQQHTPQRDPGLAGVAPNPRKKWAQKRTGIPSPEPRQAGGGAGNATGVVPSGCRPVPCRRAAPVRALGLAAASDRRVQANRHGGRE